MSETIQQVQQAFTAYTIERELGAGGMATVYLADDKKHDRKVAIIVEGAGSVRIANRDSLFQDRFASYDATTPDYDVHPGGKRFVVLDAASDQTRIEVVVNWLTELRAKLK